MGCNCGGATKANPGVTQTFQVSYQDGQKRNYLSAGEANAAVEASKGTSNPGVRTN